MYIKPENRGKFTATKKRTGKSTSQLLHSKNSKTRSRANFARMAKRGWKPLEIGGDIFNEFTTQILQEGGKIKVIDNRKNDAVTGLPVGDKYRKNADIPKDFLEMTVDAAKKHGVDPGTAIAIGLQETGFHPDSMVNPFMLGNYNQYGNIIDESVKFMADKNKYAKNLGKTNEEDIIQAYNGYGKVKNAGKMYGIDTSINPIDMNTNPVYGKRIINLRDSVVMRNPDIRRIIEKKATGGWLKGAAGGAASGASMGAMFGPWGAAIGGVAGGVLGGISGSKESDEISEVYKPAISKSRQLYDTTLAEGGMNLKRLTARTDYKGESHSNGGINLPIGSQVEDGESRTGDIVHSKKIKVTPAIMNAYRGRVHLRKGDMGRSISDIVKSRDKRFEKRSGDEWNDNARKVSQMPFEEMSDELSQVYDMAKGEVDNMMAGGGKMHKVMGEFKRGKLHSGSKKGPLVKNRKQAIAIAMSEAGMNKAAGGMDLAKFFGEQGNAPIIGSAIGTVTNLLREPEKVDYEQAKFTPTEFTPMNTEAGVSNIRRSFAGTRERLRRMNPRGYMNNIASLGAAEAETIGSSVSQIGLANTEQYNRVKAMDSQARNRTAMFNTQIGMQEAEANAANKGVRKTAIDANLNNTFTMMGQKARDEKLFASQKDYQDKMYELQKGYQSWWKNPNNNATTLSPELDNTDFLNTLAPDDYSIQSNYNLRQGTTPTGYADGGRLAMKASALLSKRKFRTY
jgi:hypothetical protein